MNSIEYTLSYLPLFYDDLEEHILYISAFLCNKSAANNLLDAIESAILKRLPNAESFEPYHSKKDRKYPYYRIYVKDYTIVMIKRLSQNSGKPR